MAFCKNCGQQISDEATICPFCGTDQGNAAPQPQNQGFNQNYYDGQYEKTVYVGYAQRQNGAPSPAPAAQNNAFQSQGAPAQAPSDPYQSPSGPSPADASDAAFNGTGTFTDNSGTGMSAPTSFGTDNTSNAYGTQSGGNFGTQQNGQYGAPYQSNDPCQGGGGYGQQSFNNGPQFYGYKQPMDPQKKKMLIIIGAIVGVIIVALAIILPIVLTNKSSDSDSSSGSGSSGKYVGTWGATNSYYDDDYGVFVSESVTLVINSDNKGTLTYSTNYTGASTVNCEVNGDSITFSNGAAGKLSKSGDSTLTITRSNGESLTLTKQ